MSTITPVHCYRCQRQYAANLNSLDTKCPECGSDSFAKVRPPSTNNPGPSGIPSDPPMLDTYLARAGAR